MLTNTIPNNKNLTDTALFDYIDIDALDESRPPSEAGGLADRGFPFTKRLLITTNPQRYSTNRTSTLLTLNQALNAGMGALTDNSCGALVYGRSIICSSDASHSKITFGGSSCKQPACPVCYTSWAFRGAQRIYERIDGYQKFDHFPPKHIILGADPKEIDLTWLGLMVPKKGLAYLKQYFRDRAFKVGLIGGAMVIHLYRIKKEVHSLIPFNVKKWAWIRSQGSDKFHSLVDFSPHCHIIGYGYTIPIQKGNDSFLYRSKGNLKTADDIKSVAFYILSHSPVIVGCTSVTYFGHLSYNKLKSVKTGTKYETVKCPDCGAPMIDEGSRFPVYRHVDVLLWYQVAPPPHILPTVKGASPLGSEGSPSNCVRDKGALKVFHDL